MASAVRFGRARWHMAWHAMHSNAWLHGIARGLHGMLWSCRYLLPSQPFFIEIYPPVRFDWLQWRIWIRHPRVERYIRLFFFWTFEMSTSLAVLYTHCAHPTSIYMCDFVSCSLWCPSISQCRVLFNLFMFGSLSQSRYIVAVLFSYTKY